MNKEPHMISIRDLGVVAALVTCGFEVVESYRDPNGRTYFVFREATALDEAVSNYYADTLNVKARRFFDNTKMLKGRIYSER